MFSLEKKRQEAQESYSQIFTKHIPSLAPGNKSVEDDMVSFLHHGDDSLVRKIDINEILKVVK